MTRSASATTSRERVTIRPFSQPIVIPSRPSGRTAFRTTRSSMTDQLADALRAQRHLVHAHAEGGQRVLDGLGHERGHRDGAGLADALDPERIERRDRLEVDDLDGWQLARRGDVKLQERPREQLPGRVELQLLVERA